MHGVLERLELGSSDRGHKTHSRGSDQEASLSSLAPGSLRDSLQGYSDLAARMGQLLQKGIRPLESRSVQSQVAPPPEAQEFEGIDWGFPGVRASFVECGLQ